MWLLAKLKRKNNWKTKTKKINQRKSHCQRRSVAKSAGCFQRRVYVCQHDNFQTSIQQ